MEITGQEVKKSAAEIIGETVDKAIVSLAGDRSRATGSKVLDNLIAFVGAAGGVGTSTIVANLAVVLSKKGLNVLIVDTNIQYPAMHRFFGIKQEAKKEDLVSFALGKNRLGDSLYTSGDISVLCANNRTLIDAVNCDTEKCSANIFKAIDQVRGLFDIILFDCSNRLDLDMVNVAVYNADAVYLVWDESLGCISNTDRIRRGMELTGIEAKNKVRLVMNKRTSIQYSKYPIKELGYELVSVLPFDVSVIESGLRGGTFVTSGESIGKNALAFANGIVNLAEKVLEVGGYAD